MTSKGFTRNFRPLEILTEDEVEAIHRGTLNVLEKTGIRVEHKGALKLFKQNGCKVDYNEMRVRIPSGLVEECLRKAPSSYYFKARDPERDVQIGGNTFYFEPFPGMRTVDLDTWKPRPATEKERDDACVILDALDSVQCISPYTPYFEVEGVSPVMAIPEGVAAMLRNSTKPQISTGHSRDSEIFTIEMAKAVGTEIGMNFNMAPPLTAHGDIVEAMFRAIQAGFPVWLTGGVAMGATGPATMAGATIVNNAQNISGVVLSQLIKPGTRVMSSHSLSFAQDMRSGALAFGGVEGMLHVTAFNQIWRKYEIPRNAGIPGISSSKTMDFQSGYEKAMGALVAALSGSSIIMLHGGVYGELSWHPVQAILDDDIAGMICRFIEGVEVNDETLAVDLINSVGPIPGMYLDKKHTRDWWKKEQFLPKVADRLSYPDWLKKGKKSAQDYAKDRMADILATHKPKPLNASQEEEIERILGEARQYYQKKGMM